MRILLFKQNVGASMCTVSFTKEWILWSHSHYMMHECKPQYWNKPNNFVLQKWYLFRQIVVGLENEMETEFQKLIHCIVLQITFFAWMFLLIQRNIFLQGKSIYIYICCFWGNIAIPIFIKYHTEKPRGLGGWLNCIKMNIASVYTFCFGRVLLGSWKHVMYVLKSLNLFQLATKHESKPVKTADFVDIWYHKNYFLLDTLVLSQMLLEIYKWTSILTGCAMLNDRVVFASVLHVST